MLTAITQLHMRMARKKKAFFNGNDIVEVKDSFFSDLNLRFPDLPSNVRDEVMIHVDYLAGKAGITSIDILAEKPFKVEQQVLLDAKKNINSVLGVTTHNIFESKPSNRIASDISESKLSKRNLQSIEKIIALAERTLEGWCTREKAMAIANLITSERPQICVEIGIYGGRSLVPAAAALRENGTGAIYGIETWRPDVATEHATNEANDAWWKSIDFHAIKTSVYRFIAEHGLSSQIRIIEAPSADAASLFTSIDYLHIDGAHSIYNAAEDVVLYSKKVKSGGIIIMDDAEWPTTAPAIAILDSLGDRMQTLNTSEGVPSCIIYRKR